MVVVFAPVATAVVAVGLVYQETMSLLVAATFRLAVVPQISAEAETGAATALTTTLVERELFTEF